MDEFSYKLTKNPLDRIILVGMMGSGKSTIGELLSRELGWTFIDTDKLIEERVGLTVAQLFAYYGEREFRKLESSIIHSLRHRKDLVIATGGGLPCHFEVMDQLLTMGLVIYLEASVDVLFERLKGSNRPLMKGKSEADVKSILAQLLSTRSSVYQRAKYTLQAEAGQRQIIRQLMSLLDKSEQISTL